MVIDYGAEGNILTHVWRRNMIMEKLRVP
jgi:hypothetical protein